MIHYFLLSSEVIHYKVLPLRLDLYFNISYDLTKSYLYFELIKKKLVPN